MRRSIPPLLGVMLIAAAALPAQAATRAFPVPDFARLRVEGPYTVRVRTGAKVSVRASGPQDRIDRLIVEPRGQTLVVTGERGWNWNMLRWSGGGTVIVDITVPMLESADLSGPGDVTIDSIRATAFTARLSGPGDLTVVRLDSDRLRADLSGPGGLTISGKAGRTTVSLTGPGDFHGNGLVVDHLDATLTGPGTIAVGPTRVARATLTGPGDIVIAGTPRCTVKKTGPGSIICGN